MTRREALSHPLAIAGVVITTVAAVLFMTLLLAALAGMLTNPYAGLIVLIGIPALFVAGPVADPAGGVETAQASCGIPRGPDWPVVDLRVPGVRRTTLLIVALTAVNIVIVLLAGYGGLHAMETPTFCGQTCHTPMTPQFTAWRAGPHARVACVDCHIGEGAKGFVHAKAGGVRQLIELATNTYSRPIPPGAAMPPGAQAGPAARVISRGAPSAIACASSANTQTMRRMRRRSPRCRCTCAALLRHRQDPPSTITRIPTSAWSTWRPTKSAKRFRTSR